MRHLGMQVIPRAGGNKDAAVRGGGTRYCAVTSREVRRCAPRRRRRRALYIYTYISRESRVFITEINGAYLHLHAASHRGAAKTRAAIAQEEDYDGTLCAPVDVRIFVAISFYRYRYVMIESVYNLILHIY